MSNFYFVGQQIIDAKTHEVQDVELLLRFKKKEGFPEKEFHKLLNSTSIEYLAYLKYLDKELNHLKVAYPGYHFSLNFTQQELEFPEALAYLEHVAEDMRDRILIEITEEAPERRFADYSESINVAAFKRLHDLGYKIALDDIMQGNNSIGNFMLVRQYISRIKWSFVNGGQNLNQQQIYWTIQLLRSLTVNEDISLVVEGVEEEMVSYWLLTMSVHNQQGFLFAKPEKL